jgi:hypothetical protein
VTKHDLRIYSLLWLLGCQEPTAPLCQAAQVDTLSGGVVMSVQLCYGPHP